MFDGLLRLLCLKPREPQRAIELTVADQWVLKVLLRDDKRALLQQDLVHEVMEERPTLIPHEVRGAVQKLTITGALLQEESEAYHIAPRAKRLKSILPENPSVSIDYYG